MFEEIMEIAFGFHVSGTQARPHSSFVDLASSRSELELQYQCTISFAKRVVQESVLFSLLQILIIIPPLYRLNARFPLHSKYLRIAIASTRHECWYAQHT